MDVTQFQETQKLKEKKKSLGKGISNCWRGREYIPKYEKNDENSESKQSYMNAN